MRIIIPVYNEAANVGPLLTELAATNVVTAVDFIDDSPSDETQAAIAAASACCDLTVTSLHRTDSATGGLAGAVIDGLSRAKAAGTPFAAVMDGDLQHDPAYLPAILQSLQAGADLVATSRYTHGGSREGLDGPVRYFVSWASTRVAKGLFPRSLSRVSDPMTGYFGVRLSAIDLDTLKAASGFKILLELLVSHRGLVIREIPVIFRHRQHGNSKGTMARGVEYGGQLLRLRCHRSLRQYVVDGVVTTNVAPTR